MINDLLFLQNEQQKTEKFAQKQLLRSIPYQKAVIQKSAQQKTIEKVFPKKIRIQEKQQQYTVNDLEKSKNKNIQRAQFVIDERKKDRQDYGQFFCNELYDRQFYKTIEKNAKLVQKANNQLRLMNTSQDFRITRRSMSAFEKSISTIDGLKASLIAMLQVKYVEDQSNESQKKLLGFNKIEEKRQKSQLNIFINAENQIAQSQQDLKQLIQDTQTQNLDEKIEKQQITNIDSQSIDSDNYQIQQDAVQNTTQQVQKEQNPKFILTDADFNKRRSFSLHQPFIRPNTQEPQKRFSRANSIHQAIQQKKLNLEQKLENQSLKLQTQNIINQCQQEIQGKQQINQIINEKKNLLKNNPKLKRKSFNIKILEKINLQNEN